MIGSTVGGILGGIIGAIPSFGIGAAPGAAIGTALGGGVDAVVASSKAKNASINPVDLRQKILLDEIIRKRKMLESGAMYQPQQEAIQQMTAQTMNNKRISMPKLRSSS